jgi:hypothetical protein
MQWKDRMPLCRLSPDEKFQTIGFFTLPEIKNCTYIIALAMVSHFMLDTSNRLFHNTRAAVIRNYRPTN